MEAPARRSEVDASKLEVLIMIVLLYIIEIGSIKFKTREVIGSKGRANVAAPGEACIARDMEDKVDLEHVELRRKDALLHRFLFNPSLFNNVSVQKGEKFVKLRREIAENVNATGKEEVLAISAEDVIFVVLSLCMNGEDPVPRLVALRYDIVRVGDKGVDMN